VIRAWMCGVAVAAAIAGCGGECRVVETRKVDLTCEANSQFKGEIHLDSAAVYDSFIADQCLPSADDDDVQKRVEKVNFNVDAVFVAGNTKKQNERCIESRDVDRVEVCDDGLRLTFKDTITDATPCPGVWTTAVKLTRGDLRAAIGSE
jgi:hypothetical protein